MKAYKLLKSIPGLNAGAVFVHDKNDIAKGSIFCGCLKLAWEDGRYQDGWYADSYILPGQLAQDVEWFAEVKNKSKYYI